MTFYEVPAFGLLFGAMALAAAVACGAHLLVRRRFRTVKFSDNNAVGGIVLGVVGGLFAIMLAFVVGIVWREYDDSSQRVAGEVAAATNVWYAASGFPQPQRRDTRAVLLRYGELMVHEDWPAMRRGGAQPARRSAPRASLRDGRTVPAEPLGPAECPGHGDAAAGRDAGNALPPSRRQ